MWWDISQDEWNERKADDYWFNNADVLTDSSNIPGNWHGHCVALVFAKTSCRVTAPFYHDRSTRSCSKVHKVNDRGGNEVTRPSAEKLRFIYRGRQQKYNSKNIPLRFFFQQLATE